MLSELKHDVCQANLDLVRHGLVILTWGNVSAIDRASGLVAIKPSGVSYDTLTPEEIVVVDLEGRVVEGALRPSSDTATHLALYRAFPEIGGICHTHSTYATAFSQAQAEIPPYGTTHADHFWGPVPVTRPLTPDEVAGDYEAETGAVIVARFQHARPPIDPGQMSAVLVANHGPFTWGATADKSVENAVALEQVALMALTTQQLRPEAPPAPQYLLDKHFFRKHGRNAYYGQK